MEQRKRRAKARRFRLQDRSRKPFADKSRARSCDACVPTTGAQRRMTVTGTLVIPGRPRLHRGRNPDKFVWNEFEQPKVGPGQSPWMDFVLCSRSQWKQNAARKRGVFVCQTRPEHGS
jgi:hypothetical protein